MASTTWFGSLFFHSVVILLNPFVPNAPFFLPPENRRTIIGNKWVNVFCNSNISIHSVKALK